MTMTPIERAARVLARRSCPPGGEAQFPYVSADAWEEKHWRGHVGSATAVIEAINEPTANRGGFSDKVSPAPAYVRSVAITPLDGGAPGFEGTNGEGRPVREAARPARYVAHAQFEWEGNVPAEIDELIARSKV